MGEFLYTNRWYWEDVDDEMEPKTYTCYNCGETISSKEGYNCSESSFTKGQWGKIYICHICKRPTYFFIMNRFLVHCMEIRLIICLKI